MPGGLQVTAAGGGSGSGRSEGSRIPLAGLGDQSLRYSGSRLSTLRVAPDVDIGGEGDRQSGWRPPCCLQQPHCTPTLQTPNGCCTHSASHRASWTCS